MAYFRTCQRATKRQLNEVLYCFLFFIIKKKVQHNFLPIWFKLLTKRYIALLDCKSSSEIIPVTSFLANFVVLFSQVRGKVSFLIYRVGLILGKVILKLFKNTQSPLLLRLSLPLSWRRCFPLQVLLAPLSHWGEGYRACTVSFHLLS